MTFGWRNPARIILLFTSCYLVFLYLLENVGDIYKRLAGKQLFATNHTYVMAHITNSMPNMTLAIPEELHKKMKRHTELKWSDIARQAFERKVNEMEFMDRMLKNSRLTEADSERIGHSINSKIRKRIDS
jgi:hypothetical protein